MTKEDVIEKYDSEAEKRDDIEEQQVTLQEQDDSPIEEVRVTVPSRLILQVCY